MLNKQMICTHLMKSEGHAFLLPEGHGLLLPKDHDLPLAVGHALHTEPVGAQQPSDSLVRGHIQKARPGYTQRLQHSESMLGRHAAPARWWSNMSAQRLEVVGPGLLTLGLPYFTWDLEVGGQRVGWGTTWASRWS